MLSQMLQFGFMQDALLAALAVSVLAGVVGYLLVLRAASFAGHALSHIAFAGASAALLAGWPPLPGMIGLPVLAGAAIGAIERPAGRRGGAAADVAIGLLLAASLAVGLLCLHFATGSVSAATSLLFGNILGIDRATLWVLCAVVVAALAGLAWMHRTLLFVILQPDLAEAQGVRARLVWAGFMMLAGVAVAASAQIVGVLLTFALMVAPPAAAQRLTRHPRTGAAVSVALALAQCWAGLVASYLTDWPVSVWIVGFGVAAFVLAWAVGARLDRR